MRNRKTTNPDALRLFRIMYHDARRHGVNLANSGGIRTYAELRKTFPPENRNNPFFVKRLPKWLHLKKGGGRSFQHACKTRKEQGGT